MPLPPNTLPGRAFQSSARSSRLLFHWRAADLSLAALTGQTPTFVRGSAAWAHDARGAVRRQAHSLARFEWADADGDSSPEAPHLLIEYGRSNLCTYSEQLSSWTSTGTPAVIDGAVFCGEVGLGLITDDDGAAQEQKWRAVSFTGDGPKAISCYVMQGWNPAAGGSFLGLYDTTAPAWRLQATLTWGADGVPSLAMTSGRFLGAVRCQRVRTGPDLAIWRLLFEAVGVVAANANTVIVAPAATAAQQGNLYVGGIQAEDAPFPSSYLKTDAGTTARSADVVTYAVDFADLSPELDDFTLFLELPRPPHADCDVTDDIGGWCRAFKVGGTGGYLSAYFNKTTRYIIAQLSTASSVQASLAIPAGASITICAQFTGLTEGGTVRLDVGSGFTAWSGAAPAVAALASSVLSLGSGGVSDALGGGLRCAKLARGLYTLDQMREAF